MQSLTSRQSQSEETWLLTGCSRGVGLEFVKQLLAQNKRVVATSRNIENAEELQQLAERHTNCHVYCLDISDRDSIKQAEQDIHQLLGDRSIDVLINNAAVARFDESASEADPNSVADILWSNVIGPMQVSQVFLPLLHKSSRPRVIFIGSEVGQLKGAIAMHQASAGYNMSKAALHMLASMFSIDDKCKDIMFISLSPGWVDTDMGRGNEQGPPPLSPQDSVQQMLGVIDNVAPEMNGWLYDQTGAKLE